MSHPALNGAPPSPEPLSYARPAQPAARNPAARPGILTAVCVLAMILGGLSVVINGLGAVVMYQGYRHSIPPAVAPPPPAVPLPPVNVAPHLGDYVSADGLKAPARSAAVAAVKEKVALSDDEAILLDRFLADAGRRVFPNASPAPYAPGDAQAGVAVRGGGRDVNPDHPTPAWFTTDAGRVEVGATSASFEPAGGGPALRLAFNTFTDAAGNRRWAAAAVDEWLETVRARVGRLSPYQATVLVGHLPGPDYRDLVHGEQYSTYGFRPIPPRTLSTSVHGNGVMFAALRPGEGFLVLADGRSVAAGPHRYGIDAVTGAALPPPAGPWKPVLPGSLWAMRLLAAEYALSALLGAGLAGTGLRTLLGNHATGRTFRRWAVARLCLSACCFGLTLWYGASIGKSSPQGSGRAVFALAAQCIFPVAVLSVMGSGAVRGYYAHWRQHTDLVSPHVRRRFAALCASAAARVALGATAALGVAVAVGHLIAAAPKIGEPGPQPVVDTLGHAAGLGLALLALSTCVRLLLTAKRAAGTSTAGSGTPSPAGFSLLLLAALAASAAGSPALAQKVVRVGPSKPAPTPRAAAPDPAAVERFRAAERMLADPNTRREGASQLLNMGKPGRARVVRAIFEDPDRRAFAKAVAHEFVGMIPYPFDLIGCDPYGEPDRPITEADWAAARVVMNVLVEHFTSIISTPDVVVPTKAALRKLMESGDAAVRRHAGVTYFRRFGDDLSFQEYKALLLGSPYVEVRAAAAGAALGRNDWLGDEETVRRAVAWLDSDEPSMRRMAAKALGHRAGLAVVPPRTVLAGLDSPHEDVRDAAREALERALVHDREAEGRFHAAIGLATARKVYVLQHATPPPDRRTPKPWTLPPTPRVTQAAAAGAPVPSGTRWLPWLTAALAAALVTTFGALAAVAKLTAPFLPPTPPQESPAPGEPQDWVRRAA